MPSLRALSFLLLLVPLGTDLDFRTASGKLPEVEKISRVSPQPPCDLAVINTSITAYLASDADELKDRAMYDTKYEDFVTQLQGCNPKTDPIRAQLNYFQAVVARMEAEKVKDEDPAAAADSLQQALTYINQANSELANQPYILNERGIIYEMQANLTWLPQSQKKQLYDSARNDFQQALNLSQEQNWALARSNLGNVLAALENDQLAADHYRIALHQKSDLAVAKLGIGNLLVQNSSTQLTAVHRLREAYNYLDSNSETTYGYARGLLFMGKADSTVKAKSLLSDLISDTYNPLKRGRGKAFYALGKYSNSHSEDTTLFQNSANFPGDPESLGNSFYQLGKLYFARNYKGKGRHYFRGQNVWSGNRCPPPEVLASIIHLRNNLPNLNGLLNQNCNKFTSDKDRFNYIQDVAITLFQLGDLTAAEYVAAWATNSPRFGRSIIDAYHTYIDILLLNRPSNDTAYVTICNTISSFKNSNHLTEVDYRDLVCRINNAANYQFYLGLTSAECWTSTVMDGIGC